MGDSKKNLNESTSLGGKSEKERKRKREKWERLFDIECEEGN